MSGFRTHRATAGLRHLPLMGGPATSAALTDCASLPEAAAAKRPASGMQHPSAAPSVRPSRHRRRRRHGRRHGPGRCVQAARLHRRLGLRRRGRRRKRLNTAAPPSVKPHSRSRPLHPRLGLQLVSAPPLPYLGGRGHAAKVGAEAIPAARMGGRQQQARRITGQEGKPFSEKSESTSTAEGLSRFCLSLEHPSWR